MTLNSDHPALGAAQTARLPTVSLLVAVRNEAKHLESCLRSIEAQDYPSELIEVILADGQSTDDSARVAEETCARYETWRVIDNPSRIQAAGWNLGIEIARGDLVGIVSAHVELAPSYVTHAVETLLRTGADMVGGHFTPVGVGVVGEAVAAALSSRFGTGGAAFRLSRLEREVDTVFMGMCRVETYRRFRFDVRLVRNQDDEHSYRLRDAGGRIVMNPLIRSFYKNRATLPSLASQYYQYGYWKVRVLWLHPRQLQARQLAPLLLTAPLLVFGAASPFLSWARFGLGALVMTYAAGNLAASVGMRRTMGGRALAVLPLVFATLHVSYGLGMIVGALSAAASATSSPDSLMG